MYRIKLYIVPEDSSYFQNKKAITNATQTTNLFEVFGILIKLLFYYYNSTEFFINM